MRDERLCMDARSINLSRIEGIVDSRALRWPDCKIQMERLEFAF